MFIPLVITDSSLILPNSLPSYLFFFFSLISHASEHIAKHVVSIISFRDIFTEPFPWVRVCEMEMCIIEYVFNLDYICVLLHNLKYSKKRCGVSVLTGLKINRESKY